MKNLIANLKKVHWAYLLFAVSLIGVGLCFIVFENALTSLAVVIGILVSIAAVLQAVSAMADNNRQLKFYFRMTVAVLTLAAGVVTMIAQESAIQVLTSLFGLLLIIDGSFKLQTTIQSKRYRVAGWWVLLAVAVATILGGFFLTKFPPESQNILALLLGLVLIVDGIGNFFSLFYVTTYEHRMVDFYTRPARPETPVENAPEAPAENAPEAPAEDAPEAPAEDAPAPTEPTTEQAPTADEKPDSDAVSTDDIPAEDAAEPETVPAE